MERTDAHQYYLRAEPTDEGRMRLRAHQEHLQQVFSSLRIHPRLTRPADLHWTAVFLGSPARWTRALRHVGGAADLTARDLLDLTLPPALRTAQLPTLRPSGYDVFFNGGTNAVFVLRAEVEGRVPSRSVLVYFRACLHARERQGTLPGGTTARLFRHPAFPLARERNGGRPHITLARGRVSRTRQRDVLRSVRATVLLAADPISFARADIRVVGMPPAVTAHA